MNSLAFIDESGVLARDPNQPFFGIGMLKLHDTSRLYKKAKRVKDKLTSAEFKFSNLNNTNFIHYRALLDVYFSCPECYYCTFVLDKLDPNIDINRYFGNVWDAYVGYSKLLISNNLGSDLCCVIADYLDPPNYAQNSYEESMRDIGGEKIFNATMLESHASLMIQVVDVLTGCVLYDFRQTRYPRGKVNKPKAELVRYLRRKLSRDSLARSFTVNRPSYFSVWEFRPR